jgi:hypothetical protein
MCMGGDEYTSRVLSNVVSHMFEITHDRCRNPLWGWWHSKLGFRVPSFRFRASKVCTFDAFGVHKVHVLLSQFSDLALQVLYLSGASVSCEPFSSDGLPYLIEDMRRFVSFVN